MERWLTTIIFIAIWLGGGYLSMKYFHTIKIKLYKWETQPLKVGSFLWRRRKKFMDKKVNERLKYDK